MSGIAPRGPASNLQTNNPFGELKKCKDCLLGNVNNVNSLFSASGSTSSNPFATAPSNTSPFGNAFSVQAPTTTATSGGFGMTNNPFASSTSTVTNNPFATAPSTNPFSTTTTSPQPATTGGLFGSIAATPFGTQTGGQLFSINTPTTSLSGAAAPAAPTPAPATGVSSGLFSFGSSSEAKAPTAGLFGNLQTQTPAATPVFQTHSISPPATANVASSGLNLFGAPAVEISIREVARFKNKLMKKLLEMDSQELSKLRLSERTMRNESNCKLVYSQPKWKAGQIPELPPPRD